MGTKIKSVIAEGREGSWGVSSDWEKEIIVNYLKVSNKR
jgi:hypothetical protein